MNQTNITLSILAVSVMVGAVTGVASAHSEDIPEEVRIGGVFDISGEWSLEGEEARSAAELAVKDFNEYLAAIGADWTMVMRVEDAQANNSVALDKIQSLKGSGIDLLIGMGYSSHILLAKSYIDTNNILVISHASQAVNLAIDDSIFRLVPNDSNQSPAVNAMLKDAGIEVLATIIRNDPWGNGLSMGVTELFEGEIVELSNYNPQAFDVSVEVSFIDEQIGNLVEEHGADKVGVLYVGTSEFELMVQQLEPYNNADKVRWFSTNTQSQSVPNLIDDPLFQEFYENTNFAAIRTILGGTNSITKYVDSWAYETYNRTAASGYTYPSYDSVWLLGTSILQAQTTDVDALTEVVPLVAARSLGSAGPLGLSEAGDLAQSTYEVWQVVDGEWTRIAGYESVTQSLTP